MGDICSQVARWRKNHWPHAAAAKKPKTGVVFCSPTGGYLRSRLGPRVAPTGIERERPTNSTVEGSPFYWIMAPRLPSTRPRAVCKLTTKLALPPRWNVVWATLAPRWWAKAPARGTLERSDPGLGRSARIRRPGPRRLPCCIPPAERARRCSRHREQPLFHG